MLIIVNKLESISVEADKKLSLTFSFNSSFKKLINLSEAVHLLNNLLFFSKTFLYSSTISE
ncbi:Uncharacterised protein [Chlamydia trachomatis]|nr:Uncharacterised protein [Chlamydia trachomatis]